MNFKGPLKILLINSFDKLIPAKFKNFSFGTIHSNRERFSKGGAPAPSKPFSK